MWYGLTKKNIVHGLIIFVVIGAVAVLLGLVAVLFAKPGPGRRQQPRGIEHCFCS